MHTPYLGSLERPQPFICTSCGTHYAPAARPPARCLVCRQEGRATPVDGPAWTTLPDLARRHQNIVQRLDPDLYGIRTLPTFPRGQRALLLRSPSGNVLWDCVALIDDATQAIVRALGGLGAIAVSHPRAFASAVEWSHAFGGTPIYLHASGRRWLMRPDRAVRFWDGERLRLHDRITLAHAGGRCGGTMLHWPGGAEGGGMLLTGDVLQVVRARDRVGFLASVAGLLPRSAAAVTQIVRTIEGFSFDRLYDSSAEGPIARAARRVMLQSAAEYVAAVTGLSDRFDTRSRIRPCSVLEHGDQGTANAGAPCS